MHYTLMGKMRLPFIDSGLLYRGALYGRFDCKWKVPSSIYTDFDPIEPAVCEK